MFCVSSDDVHESADREWKARCRSGSTPDRFIKTRKQLQGCRPEMVEFIGQRLQRSIFKIGSIHEFVLIHTGQVRIVVSSHPKGPVRENPLRVDDVADHLFGAPFPFFVSVVNSGFREGRKQISR